MTEPTIILLVTVISAVSAVIGTIVGAQIHSKASNRADRSAEKRHFRELGLQMAIINFEHATKMAGAAAQRWDGLFKVPPLKVFVIQSLRVMEIMSDNSLSERAMARKIAECEDWAQFVYEECKARAKCSD